LRHGDSVAFGSVVLRTRCLTPLRCVHAGWLRMCKIVR
jgi:hypothetical protein